MLYALTHLISAHVYEELTFIPTVQIKILRHWEVKQFAQEHVAGLSGWARTRTQNMCVHHSRSWTPSPGALVSLWYHIYQPAHHMLYLKYWPSLPLLTMLALQWLRPFISLWFTYTHSTRISLIQSLLHVLRRCQWFSMTYPCPGLPQSIQLIYFPPPPPQILPNLFSDILNFSPQ